MQKTSHQYTFCCDEEQAFLTFLFLPMQGIVINTQRRADVALRTTKPKIQILGIVVRKGCVALHYSVHFFTIFLFHATIVIEGEGIGARSVRLPHRFCVCPTRSRKGWSRTQGHVYVSVYTDTAGSTTLP